MKSLPLEFLPPLGGGMRKPPPVDPEDEEGPLSELGVRDDDPPEGPDEGVDFGVESLPERILSAASRMEPMILSCVSARDRPPPHETVIDMRSSHPIVGMPGRSMTSERRSMVVASTRSS